MHSRQRKDKNKLADLRSHRDNKQSLRQYTSRVTPPPDAAGTVATAAGVTAIQTRPARVLYLAAVRPSAQPEPGREEMSRARRLSRNLLFATSLYGQLPGSLPNVGVPGMTDPMTYPTTNPLAYFGSEAPAQVGLRLARIGDEMDLRLRSPRLGELHSLAFSYIQAGMMGIFRSLNCFTNLRENMRLRRLLGHRNWVPPHWAWGEALPALLLLLALAFPLLLLQ
ncbi:bcl-2-interacting killer [Tamandua tetradactyla]|uniref:bcl-2-interacting killer n=1 Tax=Tamandua tetradactyla TaxID=48850 RepID=UPI0040544978